MYNHISNKSIVNQSRAQQSKSSNQLKMKMYLYSYIAKFRVQITISHFALLFEKIVPLFSFLCTRFYHHFYENSSTFLYSFR